MIEHPVIILANGNFPSHEVPLGKLQDANTIICCDGSANILVKNKMEPQYILGDMDSIDDTLKNKYRDRIIDLPGQDENDLRKAIVWAEKNGAEKASILGATGKRDDHSLANIFTLLQYPSQLEMIIYTDHGIFSVAENEKTFDSFTGQQISLFATDQSIEVTSNNLKYNMINNVLTSLYCGSLNESINDSFTLTLSHGQILVYQVFE
jgi:thiamine pyrophosphokinase